MRQWQESSSARLPGILNKEPKPVELERGKGLDDWEMTGMGEARNCAAWHAGLLLFLSRAKSDTPSRDLALLSA